jgi:hypothetical protein
MFVGLKDKFESGLLIETDGMGVVPSLSMLIVLIPTIIIVLG